DVDRGVERTAGMDEEIGSDGTQLRLEIARAIKFRRNHCAHRKEFSAQSLCFRQRAARDNKRELRLIAKELRQTAAEGSVAAEDENFLHTRRHGLLKCHRS